VDTLPIGIALKIVTAVLISFPYYHYLDCFSLINFVPQTIFDTNEAYKQKNPDELTTRLFAYSLPYSVESAKSGIKDKIRFLTPITSFPQRCMYAKLIIL
jgi:hypothetical protein